MENKEKEKEGEEKKKGERAITHHAGLVRIGEC
jgi:hypothetical protein